MMKKVISIVMALMLFVMPLTPAMAQGVDNQTISDSIDYLDGKIDKVGKDNSIKLLEIMRTKKGIIIDTFFASDQSYKDRLDNIGLTKDNVESALGSDRGYFDKTKSYLNKTITKDVYSTWLSNTYDDVFVNPGAPLKEFDNYVIDKYTSRRAFLVDIKDLELKAQGNIVFEYNKDNKTIRIESTGDFLTAINTKLKSRSIEELSTADFNSLITATNAVLAKLDTTDATTIKDALVKLNYNVNIVPKDPGEPSEPGDTGDTGSGGGSSGGGGGGSGGGGSSSDTKKPSVDKPSKPSEAVSISVPTDSVEVKKDGEKAVVTFDKKAIEEVSKLIDNTAEKYEDNEKVLTLDFASKQIGENAEINIPSDLLQKAFKNDISLAINTQNVSMNIPTSAISLGKDDVVVHVEAKDTKQVLEDIQVSEDMKPVGDAQQIDISTKGSKAQLDEKITLKFNIKGLNADNDKLGVYFVNEQDGTVEFISGKIDAQNNELIAKTDKLGSFVFMENNKTFQDVQGHWAQRHVESMAAKFVLDGRTKDSFVPNDSMTRAEFAKIVVLANEIDIKQYDGTFQDVGENDWYADYVQTAYEAGLITGRIEGVAFDPNALISRQEMMAIIGRALDDEAQKSPGEIISNFKDGENIADYAKEHVGLLIEKGIVGGYPDSTVKPEAKITRAEAAKIIYGFYNY